MLNNISLNIFRSIRYSSLVTPSSNYLLLSALQFPYTDNDAWIFCMKLQGNINVIDIFQRISACTTYRHILQIKFKTGFVPRHINCPYYFPSLACFSSSKGSKLVGYCFFLSYITFLLIQF